MVGRTSIMNLKLIGFVLISAVGIAQSQNAGPDQPHPVFEVASIKPSEPGGRGMGLRYLPGTRMTAQNVPLRFLIQAAYRARDFQVTGGPAWMNTERYDMTAKGEDGA